MQHLLDNKYLVDLQENHSAQEVLWLQPLPTTKKPLDEMFGLSEHDKRVLCEAVEKFRVKSRV